jgi:hypothetical protein
VVASRDIFRAHGSTRKSLLPSRELSGDPVLGMYPNGMVGLTGCDFVGHAELAQDLIHGQITINFTRKRHTIEHHICPHTNDAPNIDAVMSWCGARVVKTTYVEFRRQNVCTPA